MQKPAVEALALKVGMDWDEAWQNFVSNVQSAGDNDGVCNNAGSCQMFKSTQTVHINFHAQTHRVVRLLQAVLELAVRARTPNTLRMKIWGCTWVSLRTVARQRMKYARQVANAMRWRRE